MRYDPSNARLKPPPAAVLTLSGLVVAVIGATALRNTAGGYGPGLWLASLAVVHAAAGLVRLPRLEVPLPIRRLSLVVGVILADVAVGISSSGIVLLIGWASAGIGFAALSRCDDG
jgi:hypothetical protein